MNARGMRALVRRDLRIALGQRAVVLPALIVPALLVVVLPALAGLASRVLDADALGDLQAVLDLLPASAVAGLPEDPALQASVLAVTHLLAPLVMVIPVMFAAVIAADAVAGERERGTLEGVLLTPLTDREVIVSKLLAALLPAVALGLLSAATYAGVANLTVGLQVGRAVLPTAEFAVMALWVGPAFAAASLGAVLLVSVRVSTTQEAFQLGGVVVLPVIALMISQAAGALLLSVWLLAVAGAAALVVAGVLVAIASSSLSRTRLGERL